jgi:hypothetical protein
VRLRLRATGHRGAAQLSAQSDGRRESLVNWDAVGAIGEIFGAAAVVVSLLYLASQIRTQNREARAASVHQVLHEYSTAISRLHEPEMADIWVAAIEDFESLGPSQRLRFVIYLMVAVRSFEGAYFQWREGRLEDDVWRALLPSLLDVKSTEAFARFWELRRHQFRNEFAEYIDSLDEGKYSF